MNKKDRLEYMKKRFPQLESEAVDAVLPFTDEDVKDELSLLEGYREYKRDRREHINSDEI
ncbi:MAG TPA: hypothetical protein PKX15_03415 [Bacteroidales bacterium]|nr:hypothetical protein [Bacteroidales bacterium]